MMTGELLFEEPPKKNSQLPNVDWPAFNFSLFTAFKELMSTPSRVTALEVVGT